MFWNTHTLPHTHTCTRTHTYTPTLTHTRNKNRPNTLPRQSRWGYFLFPFNWRQFFPHLPKSQVKCSLLRSLCIRIHKLLENDRSPSKFVEHRRRLAACQCSTTALQMVPTIGIGNPTFCNKGPGQHTYFCFPFVKCLSFYVIKNVI